MKHRVSLWIIFLSVGFLFFPDFSTLQAADTLAGAHGINFGMSQEQVIQIMQDRYHLAPDHTLSRDNYALLRFKNFPGSRLRLFIHPQQGVFSIEEEIPIRWDLQKPDRDNLDRHQRRVNTVLNRLRGKYGNEVFLEPADLSDRFIEADFVMATWFFEQNRWIHVIYEPQDWHLFPELNRIVVIYRDSNRDPREK